MKTDFQVAARIPTIRYEEHPAYRGMPASDDATSDRVFAPLREVEELLPALAKGRGFDLDFWRPVRVRRGRRHQEFKVWAESQLETFKSRLLDSRTDWTAYEVGRLHKLVEQMGQELRNLLGLFWSRFYFTRVEPFPVRQDTPRLLEFQQDGFTGFALSGEEIARLRALLASHEEQIRRPGAGGDSDWAMTEVLLAENHALRDHLTACLDRCNVCGLASLYMRQPMALSAVFLHLCRPGDRWARYRYADTPLPEPATTSMHYDSDFVFLKGMVYLTTVERDNGPFFYVPGTQKATAGYLQQIAGKAIPRAGIDLAEPQARALMLKLPQSLRHYSHFGDDLIQNSPEEQAYVRNRKVFLSEESNLILFDPYGLHQGGLVQAGERLSLQILLRPVGAAK